MNHTKTKHDTQNEDVSLLMKATLGATVLSLITSFSTQHITATAGHDRTEAIMSITEVGHLFEREREVLHAHSNLSRTRYATVSGSNS